MTSDLTVFFPAFDRAGDSVPLIPTCLSWQHLIAVLEAGTYGKPVLMTPECNLPEGFAANAAIRIEPSAESIAQGLQELFRAPQSALHTLGDNGRVLFAAKFTWPKVAAEMKSVYEWVLDRGPKPGCVQTKR